MAVISPRMPVGNTGAAANAVGWLETRSAMRCTVAGTSGHKAMLGSRLSIDEKRIWETEYQETERI